jgi:ankyrin repeat protein
MSKVKHSRHDELVEACRANDETAVGAILTIGGIDVNCKSSLGVTPLVAAAEGGNIELVKLLLQHNADPNHPSTSGNYPLRAAITSGDGECIMALVDAGADLDMETARGTPLTTAAGLGDVSTISVLVDRGATVDLKTRGGLTPLMLATREDQREAVSCLLQIGANPGLASKDDGKTACDIAEELGLQEVYSLLMQKCIVSSANSALQDSEKRQKDAKRERDAAAAVARQGLAQEAVVAREENAARINIIKAESAELLARLGIGKSK